jgi:hypothetical protein
MVKEGLTYAQAQEEWSKITETGASGLVRPVGNGLFVVFSPASLAIGHTSAQVKQ